MSLIVSIFRELASQSFQWHFIWAKWRSRRPRTKFMKVKRIFRNPWKFSQYWLKVITLCTNLPQNAWVMQPKKKKKSFLRNYACFSMHWNKRLHLIFSRLSPNPTSNWISLQSYHQILQSLYILKVCSPSFPIVPTKCAIFAPQKWKNEGNFELLHDHHTVNASSLYHEPGYYIFPICSFTTRILSLKTLRKCLEFSRPSFRVVGGETKPIW